MPEHMGSGTASAQAQIAAPASSGARVSMSGEPTDSPNSPAVDGNSHVDAARPQCKPDEASSIAVPAPDLKTGDGLLAEGRLEEALAAYNGYLAVWRAKLESGSSLLAGGKVDLARSRIGALAAKFLLKGDFERA